MMRSAMEQEKLITWKRFITRLILLCAISGILTACSSQSSENTLPSISEILHPPTLAPTPTLALPSEYDLAGKLNPQGQALSNLEFSSPDGCLKLSIPAGTSILDGAGKPAAKLAIGQAYPKKVPLEAFGVSIGFWYTFGPQELHFDPKIALVLTCTERLKNTLPDELSIGMLGPADEWDQQSILFKDALVSTRLNLLVPGWIYGLVGPAPLGS